MSGIISWLLNMSCLFVLGLSVLIGSEEIAVEKNATVQTNPKAILESTHPEQFLQQKHSSQEQTPSVMNLAALEPNQALSIRLGQMKLWLLENIVTQWAALGDFTPNLSNMDDPSISDPSLNHGNLGSLLQLSNVEKDNIERSVATLSGFADTEPVAVLQL